MIVYGNTNVGSVGAEVLLCREGALYQGHSESPMAASWPVRAPCGGRCVEKKEATIFFRENGSFSS